MSGWKRMELLFDDERVLQRAMVLLPIFYIIVEFIAIAQFSVVTQIVPGSISLIWPLFWLAWIPGAASNAAYIFLPIFLVGATVGAFFYQKRAARVVAFLAIFQYQAYLIGRQGSEHEFYLPLFISLIFIFLPDVWSRPAGEVERKKFLLLYWGATAYLMLVYFMSGTVKVLGALQQIGETNYFSLDSSALYVSYYLDQFQRESLLGPLIIEYPLIGWIGLMSMLYVTIGSIAVVVRPALYKLWGCGFLLFHVSTLLSINLVFIYFPLFAAFFLIASPFSPPRVHWREIMRELPVLGILVRFAERFRRTA